MGLIKWMLAAALVLDAALVMTTVKTPATSPEQSVGLSSEAETSTASNVTLLASR